MILNPIAWLKCAAQVGGSGLPGKSQ